MQRCVSWMPHNHYVPTPQLLQSLGPEWPHVSGEPWEEVYRAYWKNQGMTAEQVAEHKRRHHHKHRSGPETLRIHSMNLMPQRMLVPLSWRVQLVLAGSGAANVNTADMYACFRLNSCAGYYVGVTGQVSPGFSTFLRNQFDDYYVHSAKWEAFVVPCDASTDTTMSEVVTYTAVESDYQVGAFKTMGGTAGVPIPAPTNVVGSVGVYETALARVIQAQVGVGNNITNAFQETGLIKRIQVKRCERYYNTSTGSGNAEYAAAKDYQHQADHAQKYGGGAIYPHAEFSGHRRFRRTDYVTDNAYLGEGSAYANDPAYFYSASTGGTGATASHPLVVHYVTIQAFTPVKCTGASGGATYTTLPVPCTRVNFSIVQEVEFFSPRGLGGATGGIA